MQTTYILHFVRFKVTDSANLFTSIRQSWFVCITFPALSYWQSTEASYFCPKHSGMTCVQTVLGPVSPASLGNTLTHEHLSLSFDTSYVPVRADQEKWRETMPFTLANYGWIWRNPCSHKENLRLFEEQSAVIEEMRFFKAQGGDTLVDNTTKGIKRDIRFLERVAKEAGVNIVAGSGHYVDGSLTDSERSMTEEQVVAEMVADVTQGCDGTGIRCGVIGEIGCSWPLTGHERKVLRATAAAQSTLSCPAIIHPGRHCDAPAEIIRVLQEAGCDVSKTVMSHIDRTILPVPEIIEFAKLGSYVEWDLFGIECSHYQLSDIDMVSDAQRIQAIKGLLEAGYEDKIVVAHDIHTKHRLMKFGGHGYSHILMNIVPKMLQRGITQTQIDKILKHNPRTWLTMPQTP